MVTLTLSLKEIQGAQANKRACCFDLLLDSDTPTGAEGGWPHRACAFQEGPFGKAGPEAPAPDGGPPSHARFALSGCLWGPLRACTARGTTAQPPLSCTKVSLPRGDPEPQWPWEVWGSVPGALHRAPRADQQSLCASFVEVDKHLCAGPHLRLRKFRRGQSTAGPLARGGSRPGPAWALANIPQGLSPPPEMLARPLPHPHHAAPVPRPPAPHPLSP